MDPTDFVFHPLSAADAALLGTTPAQEHAHGKMVHDKRIHKERVKGDVITAIGQLPSFFTYSSAVHAADDDAHAAPFNTTCSLRHCRSHYFPQNDVLRLLL